MHCTERKNDFLHRCRYEELIAGSDVKSKAAGRRDTLAAFDLYILILV
jgi:hypothetical protein